MKNAQNRLFHSTAPKTLAEAVEYIRSQRGDTSLFKVRKRGYIDWKFSELAAYKGYDAAIQYADSVLRWFDAEKYADCLLITSYNAFRAAEAEVGQTQTK